MENKPSHQVEIEMRQEKTICPVCLGPATKTIWIVGRLLTGEINCDNPLCGWHLDLPPTLLLPGEQN